MKRATSWALCLSAAVMLFLLLSDFTPRARMISSPQGESGVPQEVSSAGYRSPGVRHKISVSDKKLVETLKAQGGRVIADYGSFVLMEANDAVANSLNSRDAQIVDENNLVLLNSGAIDTTTPAAQAMRSASSSGSGKQMRLVQFAGPIRPEWYKALGNTGVRIVTYIPNNAYLVYGGPAALQSVQALASTQATVQWDAPYSSLHRLARNIGGSGDKKETSEPDKSSGLKNLDQPQPRRATNSSQFSWLLTNRRTRLPSR